MKQTTLVVLLSPLIWELVTECIFPIRGLLIYLAGSKPVRKVRDQLTIVAGFEPASLVATGFSRWNTAALFYLSRLRAGLGWP